MLASRRFGVAQGLGGADKQTAKERMSRAVTKTAGGREVVTDRSLVTHRGSLPI